MSDRVLVRIDSEQSITPKENVKIVFGPHYFVDIMKEDDQVKFVIGTTHHGVVLDASEIDGELEQVIEKIKTDSLSSF